MLAAKTARKSKMPLQPPSNMLYAADPKAASSSSPSSNAYRSGTAIRRHGGGNSAASMARMPSSAAATTSSSSLQCVHNGAACGQEMVGILSSRAALVTAVAAIRLWRQSNACNGNGAGGLGFDNSADNNDDNNNNNDYYRDSFFDEQDCDSSEGCNSYSWSYDEDPYDYIAYGVEYDSADSLDGDTYEYCLHYDGNGVSCACY